MINKSQETNQHPCPNCGYCPACGRGYNFTPYPNQWPYPYYPYPYWDTTTQTTGSLGQITYTYGSSATDVDLNSSQS